MRWASVAWVWLACALCCCFEERDVGETRHPCAACLPCERCLPGGGDALPVCVAESMVAVVCGADGQPRWIDSCGNEQQIERPCLRSSGCSEDDAGVRCECTEPWQGERCEECPPQWDATRGCEACAGRWTGERCDACEGNPW